MSAPGRPLRFLGMVLGGWVTLRVVLLMPEAVEELAAVAKVEAATAAPSRAIVIPKVSMSRTIASKAAIRFRSPTARHLLLVSRTLVRETHQATLIVPYRPPPAAEPSSASTATTSPSRPSPSRPSRLSVSGWLILRDGIGGSLGPGGQLGGSQGGVRLRYELGETRQFALSARISAPIRGQGQEAGVGMEWRPRGSPVALLAEQRFGLDNASGGQALMAIGGIAPTPIAAGFRLEGYAQAGAVIRNGRADGFADGAARVAKPVTGGLSIGTGIWGGTQRGASRLDVGPSLALALPGALRTTRLTLDWRQRIAGDARPGSGPALSLGSDF